MAKKLSKDELKTPDAFLTIGQRALDLIEQNLAVIISVLVVLILIGGAVIGYNSYQKHVEMQAAQMLYPSQKKISEELAKDHKVSESTLKTYETQLKANGGTAVGLASALETASELLKSSQAEQALDVLNLVKYQPKKTDFYFGLLKMTTGLAYLDAGQPDKALTEYTAVIREDAQKAFHPEALLKSGLASEKKNDFDKAKEFYERVSQEFSNTEQGHLALQYMMFLSRKKGA